MMPVQPWVIKWCIVRVDAADMRTDPEAFTAMGKKEGDELWRAATAIGPFIPDHSHYAGWHFGHDRGLGDGVKDAILASTAPVMKELLLEIEQWLNSEAETPADFPSGIPLFQKRVKELKKIWETRP